MIEIVCILYAHADIYPHMKDHFGFRGVVVSELGGVDHLPGGSVTRLATAVNAGIDMIMLSGKNRENARNGMYTNAMGYD